MGDIPLMTRRGTFIINGAERVVVNQLHRSPGIFFFFEELERVYNARVIPDRGSWLEFEMDAKGHVIARIDRKKKFPVTLLVKALGYETNEELARLFYDTKVVKLKSEEDYDSLNGKRLAKDVISKETGEVIIEVSDRINIDSIDRLREEKIDEVELIDFPNNKDDSFLSNTLAFEMEFIKKNLKVEADHQFTNSELALLAIHAIMRPGEPTTLDNARIELDRLFFNPRTYALGSVGRYKINNKFGFNTKTETLTKEDIVFHGKIYILSHS